MNAQAMTDVEKHQLLLSCCRIVHQVSQRIATLAYSTATIKCTSHSEAFDMSLDIMGPYVIQLIESEDRLGIDNPSAEEYMRTYKDMLQWLHDRGVMPAPK